MIAKFKIIETVVYEVPAESAQQAVDAFLADATPDRWLLEISERDVLGPDGEVCLVD